MRESLLAQRCRVGHVRRPARKRQNPLAHRCKGRELRFDPAQRVFIMRVIQSSRRKFLLGCASSAMTAMTLATSASLRAADGRSDVRITRIVAFDLPSKRNKVVGKNARLDVHGD